MKTHRGPKRCVCCGDDIRFRDENARRCKACADVVKNISQSLFVCKYKAKRRHPDFNIKLKVEVIKKNDR